MSKTSVATNNYSGDLNPQTQTRSITLTDKTVGIYTYSGYSNKVYSGVYSDNKTRISFTYSPTIQLSEVNETSGWIETTSGKIQEEWSHLLGFEGFADGSAVQVIMPDNTAPVGTAPLWERQESIITISGHKISKMRAWGSQGGTGATDNGLWEIRYILSQPEGMSLSIASKDQVYGSGFNEAVISKETEKFVEDIIRQIYAN